MITTRRDIPLQDHTALPREQRTDGWYIDIETRPSCERDSESARAVLVFAQAGPDGRPITPVVTFKDIGAPEHGLAVDVTTTSESGRESRRVVTELSRVNLDPALFEIPRGFKPAEGPLSGLTAAWARTWFLLKAAVFP